MPIDHTPFLPVTLVRIVPDNHDATGPANRHLRFLVIYWLRITDHRWWAVSHPALALPQGGLAKNRSKIDTETNLSAASHESRAKNQERHQGELFHTRSRRDKPPRPSIPKGALA
jgi:hypothetical protein